MERHLAELAAGGDRTALIDETGTCTHRELAALADRVRAALIDAGAGPGDPVLVVAPLRIGAVAALLGSRLAGCVAVLVDRRAGAADVAAACAALPPRVILAYDADAEKLSLATYGPVLSVERLLVVRNLFEGADPFAGARPAEGARALLDPDDPNLVLFTSGTTSTPRGVLHTLNSLRCGTQNMVEALSLRPNDTFLLSSPLASITGVLQVESAIMAQASVVLADRFSPEDALQAVLRHGVSVIGGAPIISETIFAECDRLGITELPLRCIALGGSMIGPGVLAAARRLRVDYVRVYGSSEVPFSTATEFNCSDHDGTPLPDVEVSLRADELLVRGPHQFHGYLNPADNADAFCDGWVRTGDQAEVDGARVRITGRLKDVAVRKGLKISLAEVDAAAAVLGECAAFAVPDDVTGERVALAVHAPASSDLSYAAVVDALLATGLARWKLPEQIVLWDGELPRTASGKVIRRELADPRRHLRTLLAPRLR
ncbi:hypothetical protein A5727_04615 [Mycobacterium sp. ACS4331]|nr:hypothetical protein A5727_04615 [Mycobacterium sp. ACS4331]